MGCLPTFSLLSFLTNCVPSLGFHHNSNDSFWGGEEEQGPSEELDREIHGTITSHAQSAGMVYKPDPVYRTDTPFQERVEADSATCQVKPISGELLTDLNVPFRLSLWRITEPPAQDRSRRYLSRLSNSLDSNIIELPSIPPDWSCYSKNRTYS